MGRCGLCTPRTSHRSQRLVDRNGSAGAHQVVHPAADEMTVAVEAQRAHAACVCAHLPHDVMGQHGTCHVSLSACQDNPWRARCHIRPAAAHAADDAQHRITHRSQQAAWHAAGGTGRTGGRRVVQAARRPFVRCVLCCMLRAVRRLLHPAENAAAAPFPRGAPLHAARTAPRPSFARAPAAASLALGGVVSGCSIVWLFNPSVCYSHLL